MKIEKTSKDSLNKQLQEDSKKFLYNTFYQKYYHKLTANDNNTSFSTDNDTHTKKSFQKLLKYSNKYHGIIIVFTIIFFIGSISGLALGFAFPWNGIPYQNIYVSNAVSLPINSMFIDSDQIVSWNTLPIDQKQMILTELLIHYPETLVQNTNDEETLKINKIINLWINNQFHVKILSIYDLWENIRPYELKAFLMLAQIRIKSHHQKPITNQSINTNKNIKQQNPNPITAWKQKIIPIIHQLPWTEKQKQNVLKVIYI